MKIRISSRPAGSVLMMTLLTCVIIGITLAAYLDMVQGLSRSVYRSQTWNAAIPAAEAGIEEGMAQVVAVGTGLLITNNWTLSGTNVTLSRTLDSQSRYVVSISTSSPPVIVATGYRKVPMKTNEVSRTVRVTTTSIGTGFKGLVARGGVQLVGNITMDSFDSTNPSYSTGGRYDASKTKDNGFIGSVEASITGGGGIVTGNVGTGPTGSASGSGNVGTAAYIAGGGTGIQSGHYSSDLNLSFPDVTAPTGSFVTPTGGTFTTTNFTYTATATTTNTYPSGFGGTVTTNSSAYTSASYPSPTPVGAVTTNTTATSSTTYPSAGTYVGSVGTRVVTSGPPSGRGTWYDYYRITGYTYDTRTYTYNTTVTNQTTTSETYVYALGTDNYKVSSISMSGSSKMLVYGKAVLYISDTSGTVFAMAGQSEIIIMQGASLTVYCAGDARLAGNGVQNTSGSALDYQFKGLPTCTSIQLGGNASFTGTIYAPNADLSAGGGGNNSYDTVGAAIVGSAKFNGHFSFHYDEMLGNLNTGGTWNIASWNEL